MNGQLKWECCVVQRDVDAVSFVENYLADSKRRLLLIAGAGFDPRAPRLCEILSAKVKGTLQVLLLREERPNPNKALQARADNNLGQLTSGILNCRITPINIFATDNAVIGGREAVKAIAPLNLKTFTDVILDYSALSRGVLFPIVKFVVQAVENVNVHIFVTDEPSTDNSILPIIWEQASSIHGFRSDLSYGSGQKPARLWLPQLVLGQNVALDLIYKSIDPDDVCPILPFPAMDPRSPDRLIEAYATEMESGWKVDPRNIVYAHENNPLDLYRAIVRIDDARKIIFKERGSQIVLSPIGSKLLSIGALLAALERDLPVYYVEAIEYKVDLNKIDKERQQPGSLVHVWLEGEAYANQKRN